MGMKKLTQIKRLSVIVLSLLVSVVAYSSPKGDLNQWIINQEQISAKKLLANIHPAGTIPGVVVASPQKKDPDYFKHWIRDAALVYEVVRLLSLKMEPKKAAQLDNLIKDYVYLSRQNQLAQTLTGLGEPVFHVDGKPFIGPWGRPQNDGPALRALTLTRFAHHLLDGGQTEFVRTWLYENELPARTVIKADLEYVSHHWTDKSFCLWEEVKADHFYTRIVQMQSLVEGADLADRLGDSGAASWYRQQAAQIAVALGNHWDDQGKKIRVSLNRVEGVDYKRSELDIAVLLGALHTNTQGSVIYSEGMMSTVAQIVDSFRRLYPINQRQNVPGVAIGRYPEDIYSGNGFAGGNPWVLATAAVAEYHYLLANRVAKSGTVMVSPALVKLLSPKMQKQVKNWKLVATPATNQEHTMLIVQDLKEQGDQYLARIKYHTPDNGSMAEQMDRHSGFMTSAGDLTWSYAAFLTANWAREELLEGALKSKAKQ